MTTYDNREAWESLYEKFKPQRDAALEALKANPLQPFSQDIKDKIWELCVAVADEVKGNHNEITSGRQGSSFFPYSVVDADVSNQTVSVEYKELEILRTSTDFNKVISLCNNTIENIEHVFTKTGNKGTNDEKNTVLSLRNVLPMLSLGIFLKSGKDWLDLCHTHVEVGDPSNSNPRKIGNAISLSGHLKISDSKPSRLTSKGYKSTADEVNEICSLLQLRKNVILEGVPGTGKTRIRKEVEINMVRPVLMEIVTFHPASTYEEFVGGIFPSSKKDGKLLFNYQEGVLTRFANKAMKDHERDYILFIDEINRANIPLVMGELLTIIEPTKRTNPDTDRKALNDGPIDLEGEPWEVAVHVETDDAKSKYLRLPSNLYFLATMNTSDRSVVSMDAALRRRFAYFRIETKLTTEGQEEMRKALVNTVWKNKLGAGDVFEQVFPVLVEVNEYLCEEIGPDAMLGHSYLFIKEDEAGDLNLDQVIAEMMELNILPQIADTLTSMNKTDQHSVDSINKLLSKLPASMFRHELKAPTSGGKSLDIAVTVTRITESEEYSDPKVLFDKDDSIFKFDLRSRTDTDLPSKFPEFAYIRHVVNGEVVILAGSGTLPPHQRHRPKDIEMRKKWIGEKTITITENKFGIFAKDVGCNSCAHAGRMVEGRESNEGPNRWKNKNGINIRDYYPDVEALQKRRT